MPSLSLSMIVRDESEGLVRCLSSVSGLVDEIVIVDTGSKDGTWEIVQKMADVCQQIEWPNHFAEARNASLALATGDWVLVLDGDEELVQGHEEIKAAIHRADLLGAEIEIHNLLGGDETADFWGLRMFRRLPGVAFSGRIHEQVIPSLRRIMDSTRSPAYRFERVGARILHWGYLPEVQHTKDRKNRNISMLNTALLDSATQASITQGAYLEYKLGKELGLNRAEGQVHLERAAKLVMSMTPEERTTFSLSAEILVAAAQQWLAEDGASRAVEASAAAAQCLPDNPMVSLICAQGNYRLGHFELAQAAAKSARDNQNRAPDFFFDDVVFDMALAKLESDLARQRNDMEQAVDVLRALCQRREGKAQPQLWLLQAQLANGNAEDALRGGVAWLKEHGADPAALLLCADAADALGMHQRSRRWRELVHNRNR